jgi:oligopeptidase A
MNKILNLRSELAELLGFRNYAELSVEPKMVNSPAEVVDF